jgi:glucokinase
MVIRAAQERDFMAELGLGVDIGATKIALGLVTPSGELQTRVEIPTKSESSEQLAKELRLLIHQVIGKHEISSVGIGSAGPIDVSQGTISPVNIPIWREFPIVQLVQEATKIQKVSLIGDVVALVYGEFKLGAARGKKNVLGLVVSTGIGGGLILNGEVYNGSTWNAGYIGHTIMGGSDRQCSCGGLGCIEAISSGPNMTRWAKENGLAISEDAKFEDIAHAAREGNETAIEAIYLGTDAIALAAANASALLDLDAVILGGGVAESGEIFWRPLQDAFTRRKAQNNFLKVEAISSCELGQSAGLIGAALHGMI